MTAPAASDLTTLANVRAWLGSSSNADDDMLQRLITAASNYIQAWLNRTIRSQSYTETRDGTGSRILVLGNRPVTAVSSVLVDGVSIPAAASVGASGFLFDKSAVYLNGYVFRKDLRNVQVVYTAGFASTPPELEQAVIELIALRYKERDRIGHQSKSLAGETVTFFIGDFPASVKTILNNYKSVVPELQ